MHWGWGQGRLEAGSLVRKPRLESSEKTTRTDLEQVSSLYFWLQVPVSEWLRKIKEYLLHGFTGVLQN